MRNGILRDVIFACAGVLMVMAFIGLPRPSAGVQQQWQIKFQNTHLLPCYWVNPNPNPNPNLKPPPPGPAAAQAVCQTP